MHLGMLFTMMILDPNASYGTLLEHASIEYNQNVCDHSCFAAHVTGVAHGNWCGSWKFFMVCPPAGTCQVPLSS